MAIVLGSSPWLPSELQQGRPLGTVLQAALDAANRAWLDVRNYVFAFPRGASESATTDFQWTASGADVVAPWKWRTHNPVGVTQVSLTVRGERTASTVLVQLVEGATVIGTITLGASTSTQTVLCNITPGDQSYSIAVLTTTASVVRVRDIWVSWATFT